MGIGLRPGCESTGRASDPLPVTRLPRLNTNLVGTLVNFDGFSVPRLEFHWPR